MLRRATRIFGSTIVIGLAAFLLSSTVFGGISAAKGTKIVLTNSSNGTTVLASRGDTVVVKLRGNGFLRWSEASVSPGQSTTPSVLVKTGGSMSSNGSSTTVFRVVGYGVAHLEATGSPICNGGACPTYVLLWQATVSVPVLDPPGAA